MKNPSGNTKRDLQIVTIHQSQKKCQLKKEQMVKLKKEQMVKLKKYVEKYNVTYFVVNYTNAGRVSVVGGDGTQPSTKYK